ncbi:RluA family pseudouridine synthase [Ottowia thiooxydans]|uniref:RluA family pseudouridine synthase n=1 Tax=Ottowia thiooxydans TaxID=219182 RepID=UPI000688EE39|nr:RluA family pseudouridine synthase [Ottowia thiooxydans]
MQDSHPLDDAENVESGWALEDDAADATPEFELRQFDVPAALHGDRLDRALAALVEEFSRNYLRQLIEDGAARLNNVPVRKPAQRVKVGERLEIELRPTPQTQAFVPQAMELNVLYEDEHLAVIDKPAGLVVHPAPGNWSGTLLNGLLARDAKAGLLPRAGIVHRLDKDTSGLMVVARSRVAMEALVACIAAREVRREYLALAHRSWSGPESRTVDAAIGRDPRNRLRMAVVDINKNSGKTAQTIFELLENVDEGCMVRCRLVTGRTHQIRVHMASLGHPLLGDGLYGGAPAAGMVRQALHAEKLAFEHPITGESLQFVSQLPADLRAALANWGLDYNPVSQGE